MLSQIDHLFTELRANLRLADLADIAVIAVLLYLFLVWFRRRASRSAVLGILLIATLYGVARWWDMYVTALLFHIGFTAVLLALVIVFQADIRRGFERLATWDVFRGTPPPTISTQTIDTLVESATIFAAEHIGALIVLQGREPLERHIRGGIPLEGQISLPLLHSIFHTKSPGHDGAVLIDGNRMDSFAVHLPLSENLQEVGEGGTRHTAALGLAERSDVLVIVVSEERGAVSVAHRGHLQRLHSPAELKERLEDFYEQRVPPPDRLRWWWQGIRGNLGAKLAAVALAGLLWFLVASPAETLQRTLMVPIEYRNLPNGWVLDETKPSDARVTLSGSERFFSLLTPDSVVISLDMSDVREGEQDIAITPEQVERPVGMTVSQIEPRIINLRAYRMVSVALPVRIPLRGDLPEGIQVRAVPSTISVQLPRGSSVKEIKTEPVDVNRLRRGQVSVNLLLPSNVQLAKEQPTAVKAHLIKKKKK